MAADLGVPCSAELDLGDIQVRVLFHLCNNRADGSLVVKQYLLAYIWGVGLLAIE